MFVFKGVVLTEIESAFFLDFLNIVDSLVKYKLILFVDKFENVFYLLEIC